MSYGAPKWFRGGLVLLVYVCVCVCIGGRGEMAYKVCLEALSEALPCLIAEVDCPESSRQ
jgi:hypothetical protein